MARVLLSTMAVVLVLARAATTQHNDPARTFLATSFGMTSSDLAQIDRGLVVSRTLEVSDKREVATLGVMRVRITPEFYAERLADIANFKTVEAVLQIGTFGNPPDLKDVSNLTLEDWDIRSLRACRDGNCGVQLSAEAIGRFRQEVDWQSADAQRQANRLMRQILVDYVAGYMKFGPAASMEYADQSEPVNLWREFVSLAGSDIGGWRQFPGLRRHLLEYPASHTPKTTDLVYWSKEKVARRAVVSVTHLAISRTASESPADYAIASKHIYGTHYFVASLGLTVLLRDRSASSPATYIAYLNRSRVDAFEGVLGGITRKIVISRSRATVSDQLGRMQRTLERQFAAAHTDGT
jgi:hypothetical protein